MINSKSIVKTTISLFLAIISFNTSAETLVCSRLAGDEIKTEQYKRVGDSFLLAGSSSWAQMPISYEDNETLVFYNNLSGETWLLFFDKKTKDFGEHLIGVKLDFNWTGKCEVVN